MRAQQIDLRTDWSQRLTSIGTLLAVIAAFGTIFFTTRASQEQAALAERGQVTDRFSKAVDQLGSAQLNVRLGGIYAMERIAQDSPIDRQAIDEILTAFIRQVVRTGRREPPNVTPDVQGAMAVLGRVPVRRDRRLNLAGAYLVGANLSGADLSAANLASANLISANLTRANLEYVNLVGADFAHAKLANAKLANASLAHANLAFANLTIANLAFANLTRANLTSADLTGADLTGANLTDTKR